MVALSKITDSLNKTGKNVSKNINNKTKKLAKALNPVKLAGQGVKFVGKSIASEIPELGMIGGAIGSVFKDVSKSDKVKTPKTETTPRPAPVTENIDLSELTTEVTSGFDRVVAELRTLIDLTAHVWDVSELQLDITRRSHAADISNSKKSKFAKQTSTAKVAPEPVVVPEDKPKESLLSKFLGPIITIVTGMISAVAAGVTSLLAAVGTIGTVLAGGLQAIVAAMLGFGATKMLPNRFGGKPANQNSKQPNIKNPSGIANDNIKPKTKNGTISKFAQKGKDVGKSGFKLLKSGASKVGPVAGRLGTKGAAIAAGPAGLVAGSLFTGVEAGSAGLGLIDKAVDKSTGGENVIGTKLLSAIEKLQGKEPAMATDKVYKHMKDKDNRERLEKLRPINQTVNKAATMLQNQKTASSLDVAAKSAAINQINSPNSTVNAPVTNNIQNTNVMPGNILTRNPSGIKIGTNGLITY